MPDTHLVMPRTLSAPYAELLEAETPQTMTASDAPPNGTAAAAAAFARLLASGDHAMQPEASNDEANPALQAPELAFIQKFRQLPDHLAAYLAQTAQDILAGREPAPIPGLIAACSDDASVESQRPLSLRDMLLGSTTLPTLGMTIAEASQKTADLLAENDGPGPLTDEQADALAARWSALENAVIGAMPHTILDAASILDRIFPDDATHIPQRDIPALRRVATFLRQVVEAAQSASPDETSIIPSIGMTFRQAANRVREMVERANDRPRGEDDGIKDKAEIERREAARDVEGREWGRILGAIMSTPAQTVGDLFAKVERLACPSLGIRQTEYLDAEVLVLQEDVARLQSLWGGIGPSTVGEGHPDADILALGRRRAELIDQIDELGKVPLSDAGSLCIEWKEVDHLIMELEPKTGAGLAVQLETVWRQLDPEPGEERGPTADSTLDRVWLWTAMKNAERIGRGGAQPGHGCQDAALLLAWGDYREAYSALYAAAGTDEEDDSLAHKLSACCKRVENIPAATMEGVLLKLRYLFAAIMESQDAIDAAVYGMPASSELLQEISQDHRRRMLWSMIQPSLTAAVPVNRDAHADASEISSAYDALLDAMKAESALPEDMSDEEREPYENKMMAAADHLADLAPKTLCDAAILLRYLFLRNCDTLEAERAFLCGTEPNEADLVDFRARILWQVVKMLEALPAAANDQHQEPDAFADTVAAFEAEAPVTLALPQEPTGRMVDAGASAAGITPAQFQAAYAAAVEALKLERAA